MELTCHPRLGGAAAGEAKLRGHRSQQSILFISIYLLEVSRMNHEVALWMLAHWADLWSLLTDNDVTAVRALPHHILVA